MGWEDRAITGQMGPVLDSLRTPTVSASSSIIRHENVSDIGHGIGAAHWISWCIPGLFSGSVQVPVSLALELHYGGHEKQKEGQHEPE